MDSKREEGNRVRRVLRSMADCNLKVWMNIDLLLVLLTLRPGTIYRFLHEEEPLFQLHLTQA
jgi:hypothetical protein